MTGKDKRPENPVELHQQAEETARQKAPKSSEYWDAQSPDELRAMLRELRAHQIELESQNESLRRARQEREILWMRFKDFYNYAPVGCLIVSAKDRILEANFTAATLLRVSQEALIKQPLTRFLPPEDHDIYRQYRDALFETGAYQVCELRVLRTTSPPLWVRLEATAAPSTDDDRRLHVVMSDISERKQAQARLESATAKFETLIQIASLSDTSTKAISDNILSSIIRLAESKFGFYGFVNEDESVMTIHAWSGEAMQKCTMVDKPQVYPIREAGVWGEAIRSRSPLILNDYAADHPAKKGLPAGHVGLTNLLVVPVFSKDRITAVVAVANRREDYCREDVLQIETFLAGIQAITQLAQVKTALGRFDL